MKNPSSFTQSSHIAAPPTPVAKRAYPTLTSLAWIGTFLATGTSSALAFEPANTIDRSLQEQQQQRLLDQAREQREGLATQGPMAPAVHSPEAAAAQAAQAAQALAGQSCMVVEGVGFRGATLLPNSVKQQIALQASGHCLDQTALARLLDEVNDWYVEHGYVTSHAWLPQQDAATHALVIAAAEGKLAKVYFEDGTSRENRATQMAFAGTVGEPLNLRDIEQGVEQIERVVPDGVKVAVRAAAEEGYSDVVLSGKTAPLISAALSFDNAGQANTGLDQLGAAITLNNGLGLGEQLGLSATSTVAMHGDPARRNYGAFATLPLGYWTFSYAGAAGSYAVPLQFYGTDLRYHGSSLQNRFTVARMLERNAVRKIDAFVSVSNYVGNAYLEEFQLTNSSERVSTAQFGVNFATRVGRKGYFTFSPTFTAGLPFATRDMRAGGGPAAGFAKPAFSASFYQQITQNVAYLGSGYAQSAPKALYSSERISVGGETSVRGFRDQYLYGNTGAYLRNEINWTLPLPALGTRVTLTAAVDAGRVVPVEGEPSSGGNVLGAAIGASTSWKGVSASFSVGVPLRAPAQLKADPVVLNFRLRSSF